MSDKELAYAKQGAMATRSWDCFQRLIRCCLVSDHRVAFSFSAARNHRQGLKNGAGEEARRPKAYLSGVMLSVTILLLIGMAWLGATPSWALTRTLRKGPALVIVTFGTTTDAKETYDAFSDQLQKELPEEWRSAPVTWAYTSEIVRERVNKQYAEQGDPRRLKSLIQVLADLEDQGYRKVAVQSLHIFPGQEYEQLEREIAAFRGLGMHIEYGGTLLHRWDMLFAAVNAVAPDFLPKGEGCTLLVTHGTPQTFPGSNSTYLGLDRYLTETFGSVSVGTVDGIISRKEALGRVKGCAPARVRVVPFMYVAGDHIMSDIMGDKPDKEGVPSWAMELQAAGVKVEAVTTEYQGRRVFKGLGFYPEINNIFIKQLIASLERLER